MYADLVGADEFLGSHVLRVPNSAAGAQNVGGRETRGKARQFTTVNGRTVVVKDSWVYSNKGWSALVYPERRLSSSRADEMCAQCRIPYSKPGAAPPRYFVLSRR
jgi:hypothetical protein